MISSEQKLISTSEDHATVFLHVTPYSLVGIVVTFNNIALPSLSDVSDTEITRLSDHLMGQIRWAETSVSDIIHLISQKGGFFD